MFLHRLFRGRCRLVMERRHLIVKILKMVFFLLLLTLNIFCHLIFNVILHSPKLLGIYVLKRGLVFLEITL